MSEKLKIFLCDHFRREAECILSGDPPTDVLIQYYESRCGRPPLSWKDMNQQTQVSDSEDVLVIGGCCTASLTSPSADQPRCTFRHVEQCFYMLADQQIIDCFIKEGSYLVTPGWLETWRDSMDFWQFDQPTARLFFRDSAKKIVLLDTLFDEKSQDHLREFSEFVDLPAETFKVGLGFFGLFLGEMITKWRYELKEHALKTSLVQSQKQAANQALALNFSDKLGQSTSEKQAIDSILELFSMLFAPKEILYTPFPCETSKTSVKPEDLGISSGSWVKLKKESYLMTPSGKGFLILLKLQNVYLGVLKVDHVAFPEYLNQYISLSLDVINTLSLAINNLRATQNLRESEEKYRSLFNDAHDMIHVVDPQGILTDSNPSELQTLGYSRKELVGKHLWDITHPDNLEESKELFRRALKGEITTIESALISRQGEKVEVEASIMPQTENDNVVAIRAILRNITVRNTALREKEELIHQLQVALEEIRTLEGMIPICSYCKNIKNDVGSWERLETYISTHSNAEFSHGICEECFKKVCPEGYAKRQGNQGNQGD